MTSTRLTHPDLQLLSRRLGAQPGREELSVGDARRAAVAVMLRDAAGSLEVLLIKRAEYESDPWSGHVALPGGRMESQDATLVDTAVRETREEIGVDIGEIGTLLGTLDEVYPRTPVLPPVVVRPFVFAVDAEIRPVPSREVAETFWVPLASICARDAWQQTMIEVRGVSRSFLSYRHGSHVVWGLTERVLQSLVRSLDRSGEADVDKATSRI